MENELFLKIAEKYPFLSIVQYANTEHIGIIMNQDKLLLLCIILVTLTLSNLNNCSWN